MLSYLNPLFEQEEMTYGLTIIRAVSFSQGSSQEVVHVTSRDLVHKFFEQQRVWRVLMICGLVGGNTSPGPGFE